MKDCDYDNQLDYQKNFIIEYPDLCNMFNKIQNFNEISERIWFVHNKIDQSDQSGFSNIKIRKEFYEYVKNNEFFHAFWLL